MLRHIFRRAMILLSALAPVVFLVLGLACPAALADPPAFANAAGNCTMRGDVTVTFPAVAVYHGDVVYAISSSGASGEGDQAVGFVDNGSYSYFTPSFASGDQIWGPTNAINAGTAPTMDILCGPSTGPFTVDLFDRPATPASFSGVSTGSTTVSDLPFSVAHAGQYVVDASLDQGAAELVYGFPTCSDAQFDTMTVCPSVIITRSGEYSLGALSTGDYDIPLGGMDGPTAHWSLRVRELPVQISALSVSSPYMMPGAPQQASFTVSGDTMISAYVRDGAGQVVAHLGSWAAAEGGSAITWDGRGDGGAALPDGTYYLHLDSSDPNGNVTSAETSIVVDGTPPAVSMASPGTITPAQGVSFSIADSGSGVASASVYVDGQDVEDFGGYTGNSLPPNGVIGFAPDYGSWALGTHSWEIQATDNVGNQADVTGSFDVAKPFPPPVVNNPSPPPVGTKPVPRGVFAAGYFSPFQQRPARLALWVSDALIGLQWKQWGQAIATATGRETRHGYPAYRHTSRPAQVQLSQIKACGGRRVYTHVRYRIVGQKWTTGHRNGCRLVA